MSKVDNLPGLLSNEVKSMNSEQVKAFRTELIKSLPVLVRECGQKARDSNEREVIVLKCHKK